MTHYNFLLLTPHILIKNHLLSHLNFQKKKFVSCLLQMGQHYCQGQPNKLWIDTSKLIIWDQKKEMGIKTGFHYGFLGKFLLYSGY